MGSLIISGLISIEKSENYSIELNLDKTSKPRVQLLTQQPLWLLGTQSRPGWQVLAAASPLCPPQCGTAPLPLVQHIS